MGVVMLSRIGAVLALVVAAASCGSSGKEPAPAASQGTAPPAASRTAAPVVQAAEQADAARARGADPAALSTALVHIRRDGAVEVLLHTVTSVTPAQLDELRRLGAEVVGSTPTPAVAGQAPGSMVQAWVPAARVATLDALPWVAAVTAPSYGSAGG
jgi:hypothetical protein